VNRRRVVGLGLLLSALVVLFPPTSVRVSSHKRFLPYANPIQYKKLGLELVAVWTVAGAVVLLLPKKS